MHTPVRVTPPLLSLNPTLPHWGDSGWEECIFLFEWLLPYYPSTPPFTTEGTVVGRNAYSCLSDSSPTIPKPHPSPLRGQWLGGGNAYSCLSHCSPTIPQPNPSPLIMPLLPDVRFKEIMYFLFFLFSFSDPCSSNPCQNSGVCQITESFTYSCTCAAGFSGPNCNIAGVYLGKKMIMVMINEQSQY